MNDFRAPRWLPGGHVQTIWPVVLQPPLRRRRAGLPARALGDARRRLRRRRLAGRRPPTRRCSSSSTASRARRRATTPQAFAAEAQRRGWRFAVPHFRGCSGEINLAPRAYHSGDHEEVGWMLARFRALHAGPIVAVGVSLGGNALLRFAEEAGASARRTRARGRRGLGAARPRRRRPRDRPRLRPPGLHAHVPAHDEAQGAASSSASIPACSTRERCARRATCATSTSLHRPAARLSPAPTTTTRAARRKPQLARIRIPALVLNARNDPFLPALGAAAARRGRRRASRSGSRRTAATSASPTGAGPAT